MRSITAGTDGSYQDWWTCRYACRNISCTHKVMEGSIELACYNLTTCSILYWSRFIYVWMTHVLTLLVLYWTVIVGISFYIENSVFQETPTSLSYSTHSYGSLGQNINPKAPMITEILTWSSGNKKQTYW